MLEPLQEVICSVILKGAHWTMIVSQALAFKVYVLLATMKLDLSVTVIPVPSIMTVHQAPVLTKCVLNVTTSKVEYSVIHLLALLIVNALQRLVPKECVPNVIILQVL